MSETLELDLRDRRNPPPDDPERAPHGWWWNTRPTYGKGTGWYPRKNPVGARGPAKKDEPAPEVEEKVQEVLEERGFQDPAPAYAAKTAKLRGKRSAPKVNAKIKGDMSAAVGMLMMATGPALMARDPYCGSAVLENSQKITDAVIPLLCRSHTVVAFFTDSTENGWLLWFNLAIALAPVGQAVAQHHILRTVEIRQDPETGDLYAGPRNLEEFSTEETVDSAS